METIKIAEDNAGGIHIIVNSLAYRIGGLDLPAGAGLRDLHFVEGWFFPYDFSDEEITPAENLEITGWGKVVAERGSDWITLYPQRMGAAAWRYFGLGLGD